MGRFLNGVFLGVGIGLLAAPMTGEEMRRMVRERFEELRNSLPGNEQLQQSVQQGAANVASKTQDATQAVGGRKRQNPYQGV